MHFTLEAVVVLCCIKNRGAFEELCDVFPLQGEVVCCSFALFGVEETLIGPSLETETQLVKFKELSLQALQWDILTRSFHPEFNESCKIAGVID